MQTGLAEQTTQRLILGLSEIEEVGKAIVSGQSSFNASSQTYLRIVLKTLQAAKGAILRFNPVESLLAVESSIDIADESANEALVIPITPDEIGILLQCSPLDFSQPPSLLKPFLDEIQPQLQTLKATLWAPLKIHEEFLGVISLGEFADDSEGTKWIRELLNVLADHIAVAIAHSRSQEDMRAAKFRLFMLSDTTAQIAKLLDTEQLEEEIVNHAISLLDANAGCLMLINPITQQLEIKNPFAFGLQFPADLKRFLIPLEAGGDIHPTLAMLRQVAMEGKTQIRNDQETAALFGGKNLIAVPVFGREILGILVVFSKEGRAGITLEFTDEDGILLEAFATQVGVAIENARLYQEAIEKRRLQAEMEEAAQIQENLLPKAPPEIPGYEIAGMSIPHHDGVGGDYYGYIHEPDGSWGLVIADVAGKGMQAALLMATLRAALLSEVAKQADLPTRAMALNALIRESSPLDKYATLVYARLHPETGKLTSLNAGHTFPLVIRQDGSLQRLEAGGLMIGMYPDDMIRQMSAEFEDETIQLYSGDTVIFFTDGVTETQNIHDEMYDEERLEELVKQLHNADANEICSEIYDSTLEFQGEAQRFDDLTLMVLKKK